MKFLISRIKPRESENAIAVRKFISKKKNQAKRKTESQ